MNTVTTQTTQPTPMKAKPKAKAKPKQKPMSLTKRIILASDEGKSPQEIAELLGVNAQTVYSVRWQEKTRRKNTVGTIGAEMGTEHWFHQEITKEAKRQEQLTKAKEDWDRVVGASKDVQPEPKEPPQFLLKPLTPKFTITEPHAPALLPPQTFFARIKAAYATLRGVKK